MSHDLPKSFGGVAEHKVTAQKWLLLWLLALATRVAAVWLLPNAWSDAYSYAETIGSMSMKMSDGSFRFVDLWGFWLPLYQVVGAALASALHLSPLLAGRLLSACCGGASAVLVFDLTRRVVTHRLLPWLAFALVLLDPYHFFLSSLSMTDVPHAFLVLLSLHYAVKARWFPAAACAALASLMRVDSWIFILLLPALQFVRERRVSLPGIICLLGAPGLWLAVSYAARGDALAYFTERAVYVERFLEFEPARRGFGLVVQDLEYLIFGAHPLVFLLALAGCGLILLRTFPGALRRPTNLSLNFTPFILAVYFVGLLGVLAFAYVTRSQPVIWVRYGTIFLVLGLPLAAWTLEETRSFWEKRPGLSKWMAGIFPAICLFHGLTHVSALRPVIQDDAAHLRIAEQVQRVAKEEGWDASPAVDEPFPRRCFSDDPAVRVLSGVPVDRFLRTEGNEAVPDLVDFLRQEKVRYLVFTRIEHSLPAARYPELGIAGKPVPPAFKLVSWQPSPHYGPDVWLYQLQ